MSQEQKHRVFRQGRISSDEAARLNDIRQKAMEDFPPDPDRPLPAVTGVGAQIRRVREAQNLTWYSLAEKSGVCDAATVRDIEYGRDVRLSDMQAVATALGLKLELVEQT